MKIYAIERGALSRLLASRRELLAAARGYKTADEMRAARDDLMASAQVYRTPEAGKLPALDIRDGVAHIPIVGELTPSADPCGAYALQAETEYGYIQAALAAAEAAPGVQEVALDIDSPGGYMAGLDETAQAIVAVSKPVTAFVGSMAASAAYWLASQADRIVALSPASRVGSIGVAMEEYDDDEAMARDGVAHRVYTSTDAPDKRPDTKTEAGRALIVAELDALHYVFVRRVAEGRRVEPSTVSRDFGRGGMLTAEAALAVGMIDEVIGSHLSRKAGVAGQAAKAAISTPRRSTMDSNQLTAEDIAAANIVGMSLDDYCKFKDKGEIADPAAEDAAAAAVVGMSLEDYRKYSKGAAL